MANFDNILAGIHGGQDVETKDKDNEGKAIRITNKRTFELPEGFDTILGYEGDVNSQVITFMIPRSHENHDLSLCGHKTIKWKNLASGIEGQDVLISSQVGQEDTVIVLTWSPKPEIFTKAGFIEISISIYDIGTNGRIVFSWNTPTFSKLEVGTGNTGVATIINGYRAPAKNEILYIDVESRSIVMPKDYNTTLANWGDADTSLVFFQAPRIIRGIDLLDEGTDVLIIAGVGGEVTDYPIKSNTPGKELYGVVYQENEPLSTTPSISDYNNLVNIIWKPSEEVTSNADFTSGKISISFAVKRKIENGNVILENKYWSTAQFNKLTIGESLTPDGPLIENGRYTVVDGSTWDDYSLTHQVGGLIKVREHNTSDNETAAKEKFNTAYKILPGIYNNEIVTWYKKEAATEEISFRGLLLGHYSTESNIDIVKDGQFIKTITATKPEDAICIPLMGEMNKHNLYLANECSVTGNYVFGFGKGLSINADYAAGFGQENTIEEYGFSAGYNNTTDIAAVTFGKNNSAGELAAAFGTGNKAQKGAIVAGLKNTASGLYSVSFGHQNVASAFCSVTLGGNSKSEVQCSSAIGYCVQVLKSSEGSIGMGAMAIGRYNNYIQDPANNIDQLFVVGNGTSNTNRRNAFEVLSDNSIKIGGTQLTEREVQRLKALLASIELDPEDNQGGN